jgi:choline dehydrogenase-like flavoprotein
MGTCRMGDDPKESVVDKFQRSHDHKNLYLVGSSTFPTGATANPTLTIAALSLRTAKHIIDTDFRR